ncbi:MAG: 4Fe-4S dicluster domain-containing protein [Symbiobacteriia bacterium]
MTVLRSGTGRSALDMLAQSGTVGAGGAGFPTHAKLARSAEVLIANGAECEPMLYSNQELLKREAPKLVAGLLAAAEMVSPNRVVLAIKGKYKDAIAAVQAALTEAGDPPVEIFTLRDYYPAGDEHAVVQAVTGRIVPEGGLPLDVGVVVQNVETLANLAAALAGTPVTEKWVTVTGAVRQAQTVRVPIGTPLALLVEGAGGAAVPSWAIIEGGPMMGRVVTDPSQPVTKTTGGLIVLPSDHPLVVRPQLDISAEIKRARTSCIRCTQCTELCPRYLGGHDLRPHQIMQSLALFPIGDSVYDQAWLCSECGLCEAFSCPMGLSPRRILGSLKRQFGAAGRRYSKDTKVLQLRAATADRRVPGKRLVQRLGLAPYDRPAPFQEFALPVRSVRLLLRQHVGVAAEPCVRPGEPVVVGQRVADVPAGSLGAPVHASIAGVVSQVTSDWIAIEEVGRLA